MTDSSTLHLSRFASRVCEFIQLNFQSCGNGAQAKDDPFNRMALDLFTLQYARNEPYRLLCQARKVSPEAIRHWSKIPAAPTSAFKEYEMTGLPPEQRTSFFYSSGTTGQSRSRHFHNPESLAVYEASLEPWFSACAHHPGQNLVMLTPTPAQAPHSSLAHMFGVVQRKLGEARSVFTGYTDDEGVWHVDLPKTVTVLQQAIAEAQPVLLLGTAFGFVHLLDHLTDAKLQLALPDQSGAMETGGYKGRSRSLARAELHGLISERLGLPARNIIREYGMSELSSQAYDHAPDVFDKRGRHFHFPPWARVQIISPETGNEVAEGETGLIRIFDLANVYSVMAVQTEDMGIRHGDGFELLGRAAAAEPRGCSLQSL